MPRAATGQSQNTDEYKSSPSSSTAAASNAASTSKVPRKRISRACENCRARRIKCEPPYPCQGCRDAGLQDCLVRDKARPLRRRRSQQAASAAIEASSYPERTRFLPWLDEQLEELYTQRTGENISLALLERPSHPQCDLLTPLPELPQPLPPSVVEAMGLFTEYMLPFCSHMTAPRVVSLFERYLTAPGSLAPDQQALILICLALGYIRLQGFEPGLSPRPPPPPGTGGPANQPTGPGRAVYVDDADRLDVPFFRHAVDILEKWGNASFTSLHALCAMWYYTCLACTGETSRVVVSWMIQQSKELGIHQEHTAMQQTYAPTDRPDLMFVQVLYAHYWTTALSQHAPIIKPGEFETMTFRSRPILDPDAVVALIVRRSLTELLVLNTQAMMNIHDSRNATMPLDWLLRVEEKWDLWCSTWVMEGRTTGNVFTDPFLGVLWDWGRIVLRLVTLRDRRVSMSSLSVLARSATQILVRYNAIYRRLPYNLMWQHLRQVTTCAHIILLCYWRYELTKPEAEVTLSSAIWMLSLMEPRWREQASEAKRKLGLVADAIGLDLSPENVDANLAEQSTVLGGVGGILARYPPETLVDAQGALGSLYETFQNFNQDTSALPSWTIDPLFLATDYSTPTIR